MTYNQEIMSILSKAGENKQLKDLTIVLCIVAGAAVITAIVLIPIYTEVKAENKRLKLSNREMGSALSYARSQLATSNAEIEKISKYTRQLEKENIQLKNDRIGQEKA